MNGMAQDDNISKRMQFSNYLSEVRSKADQKLTGNPKFEELFLKELSFLYRKTLSTEYDVQVSNDGKSITITSYNPLMDCGIQFRDNNKSFFRTIFSLNGENMKIEYNQGTLFDRKHLERKGMKVNFPYESKMETEYTCNCYDSAGIEYSNSSYKDVNHFDEPSEDIDLREKVMSPFYKPVFSDYQLAVIPVHIVKANIRNTYRKNDSLAIIHSNVCYADKDGYHDLVCALYTSHPFFPEMLRGSILVAKTEGSDNNLKFNIVSNYASDFNELYNKAYVEFKNNITTSPLAESNEYIYNALVERLG